MKPSELTEWRKKKGFTQKHLAEKLGVAENTVFRWEKGMRPISPLLPHALRGLEAEGGEQEVKGKGKGKEVKHGKRNLQKKKL
jgi:transcriptional regulator with XRE-family HTH domain